MNKLVYHFIFGLLTFSTVLSQEKIRKSLLEEDLDVLKINLETYHTGLYTYTSEKEFDQWYGDTKNTLEDATPLDFFRKIVELNGLIKNGHTFFHINPEQRGKSMLMPSFTLYKDKEKFFISSVTDKANASIVGKQITTINNTPISDVFETLLKYEERDGNNKSQPTEELLYSFARKYALEYGHKAVTNIQVNGADGPKEVALSNIPFAPFTQKTDELYENGTVSFEINGSTALLTIPTFNEIQLKKDNYKSKLKSFFKNIKKENVKHLIIDVRNNGGGDTASVETLLSYIYSESFTFYKDVYQLHKKWDTSIIPEINSYPKNTSNWTLKKGDDGHYRSVTGGDGQRKVKPQKDIYTGELYILMNGSTLSAAAEFVSFIKNYRKATFIGDEAGGNKVQNTSGYALMIVLPNSKIIVSIPILLWKMNVSFDNDGHGIKPDHWVKNTIHEEINNEDGVINFTYQLIKK